MSQFPFQDPGQFNPQVNYASPGTVPSNVRPGAVTGLAITGLILGALGILCNAYGAVMAGIMAGNGGKNPVAGAAFPAQSSTVVIISLFGAIIGLFFWIALIAGCIAALKLRPIARSGMILWSLAMMLWQVAWVILQIVFIFPETAQAMQKMQAAQPTPMPSQMSGMMSGILIGSAIFWCVILSVLPVLFLTMWTRPRVKAAFGQGPIQQPPMQPPYSPTP